MGTIIIVFGFLVVFVGYAMFLIESYRRSFLWLIGCFLLLPVQIAFLIMHWQYAKKPFFTIVIGFVIVVVGALIDGRTQFFD